jgi:endonuclease G
MDMALRTWLRCCSKYIALGILIGGLTACGNGLAFPSAGHQAIDVRALPPCVDDDCNCGDFISQAQAQQVFESFPGDPYDLDGDGNGEVCEALPLTPPELDPPVSKSQNPHLVLGNPSQAGGTNPNNYLIERQQYVLSYSRDRNRVNWASWEVDADWLGPVERRDNFRQDGSLPAGMYQVPPTDYSDSGYDRGHLVPSGDRTRSNSDNSATFLMSNIFPQTPETNRGPWRDLENYARELVRQYDYSLHVFAGVYGQQKTIGPREVSVPSRLWKIIVVYDRLEDGRLGLTKQTQVIAVDMPNRDFVSEDWRRYQTTVDRIELATGYDFLADMPDELEALLESRQPEVVEVIQ